MTGATRGTYPQDFALVTKGAFLLQDVSFSFISISIDFDLPFSQERRLLNQTSLNCLFNRTWAQIKCVKNYL